MSEQYVIRPMCAEDVPSVFAIEIRAYAFPWTEEILRDCLRVGYSAWICEADGTIVGYAFMSMAAGEAHVLNLCVDPGWQRRGLGRRLLAHLIEVAGLHQTETLFLEVRDSNLGARVLYESMGFNEIGRRKNYYPAAGGREDALMFARALLPPDLA